MAASFGVFILLLASGYFYLSSTVQIPTQLAAGIQNQNSTVYYSNGQVLGYFGTSKRQMLTFNEIPQHLQDAVLAAEERGFWTDGAISPTGIVRAAWDDMISSGGNLSGGSTITQQFVRQYYSYSAIGTQQTTSRKIKEIFVAEKLAQSKPKWWILTNYLNTIYLGDNSNGVEAASETYFGVPVSRLTIAQDAVIAAMIQQPANYPNPKYRSALIARWHYVLNGLVVMGKLTPAEAAAQKFPTLLTDSHNFVLQEQSGLQNPRDPWAQYVMNEVYNELTQVDHYTQAQLDTGGYQIYTTISRPQEVALYQAVDQNVTAMKANGGALPAYARIGAELQDPQTGAIQAVYPGPGEGGTPAQCAQSDCSVNMTLAREQVGSSFKPYVLAAAVHAGMNANTSVLNADSPLWVPQDSPDSYALALSTTDKAKKLPGSSQVNNDDFKSHGGLDAQTAMAISSNTAYTDLAHRVGTGNIIQMAQAMGVNISDYSKGGSNLTNLLHQTGVALGIASLTINEQDTMLATVANGGTYHQAHMVAYLVDTNGNKVIPKVTVSQALSQDNDSQVQWGMSTVATSAGTAAVASTNFNRPIIAKTGTTTSNRTAYFIGAIPQEALTVGIWTRDQGDTLTGGKPNLETLNHLGNASQGGFGGYWPARIWNTFAQSQWSNLQAQPFLNPVFTGAKWVQWMAPPKPKAKPTPTPTQTCKNGLFFGCKGRGRPTTPVTQSPTTGPVGGCLPGLCTSSPTATATTTAAVPTAAAQASPAVTQSGFAIGGVLSVVPGSLLWTRAARRRRRRRREEQRQV